MPLARAAATRLYTVRSGPARTSGLLVLIYHDMRAAERARFARQIQLMRDVADLVSLSEALELLARPEARTYAICLTFDDGCQGAFDHALPILAAQSVSATFFIVPAWVDAGRPGAFDWNAGRELARSGMEVGSHSMTHRRLADLSTADVLSEMAASRGRIEAEIGQSCVHFACPWGQPYEDYQPGREPALARAAGYHSFLTTIPRHAEFGSDCFGVPRVRMEPGWGKAELRYALMR